MHIMPIGNTIINNNFGGVGTTEKAANTFVICEF